MEDTNNSGGRSKRQKIDRHGRLAALQKLRELKGSKNKYEISQVENVYEEVDEKEYSKKVLERQEDDWIVDDDGCGYVEDGREIFDDDLDKESIKRGTKRKSESSIKKPARSKVETFTDSKGSSNIRNLIANMPIKKKKETAVKLSEDDILGDIMQEIDSTSNPSPKDKILSLDNKSRKNTSFSLKQNTEEDDYLSTFVIKPKPISLSLKKKLTPAAKKIKLESDIDKSYVEPADVQPIVVKKEPLDLDTEDINEMTQIIENFDSNDGFPDSSAFDDVNEKVEEIESQNKIENKITIKQEEVDTANLVTEEQLNSGALWDSVQTYSENNNANVSVNWDYSKLPLISEDGKQVFQFYYWDAYEDASKQPGTVYLFGKVWLDSDSTNVSCCVVMKNIQRRIFLLPREERINLKTGKSTGEKIAMLDVYKEFNNVIAPKYKINEFKSRSTDKYYAFEYTDVPFMCQYLEVKYAPNLPMLPKDLKGETFSRVFGTTSSFLELLLLERKIKGPAWLHLSNPQCVKVPISWCKVEVICQAVEDISIAKLNSTSPMPPPPLVTVALSFRQVMYEKTRMDEIVMVSCLIQNNYQVDKSTPNPAFQQHFCVVTHPSSHPFPFDFKEELRNYRGTKVEFCDSERSLLMYVVEALNSIDPDLVVGHDLQAADLDILLYRLSIHRIPCWSKIGRLKRAGMQLIKKGVTYALPRIPLCGRLVCDIKISGKELIRARSYDLTTLCESILKMNEGTRIELTPQEIIGAYRSGKTLLQLISTTMQDASFVLSLMYEMNVIPLALQITNIAGNVMSKTLMGGRSERNEFLLLHAFNAKDYIVPDKVYGKANVVHEEHVELENTMNENLANQRGPRKKKPAYSGGLVLDPKVGFYDTLILLMDFNSLYPSIILEYNICFTTTIRVQSEEDDILGVELREDNTDLGILPTELRKLIESRRDVKKLMKKDGLSPDLKLQYDIRQMALKLTANSMYGCLGFANSRFYAKPLAALVTSKGREILLNTQSLVEKLNYEVIYGDTDSIMINTKALDYSEVFKIGNKIKSEVNRLYKHVELDIDGVFKYMLLLKKKKYAATIINKLPNGDFAYTNEIKGLDIVRRDWSQLTSKSGEFILNQILSEQDLDEKISNICSHLYKLKEDLENGRVPVSLLSIAKQLSKAVEDYTDKKAQSHVLVAQRLNSSGRKTLKAGDTVHYVICEDGTKNPATQRAYHVDELKQSETLKIDIHYYLSQQIHPVVSRLCNPIDGIDDIRIAECLGLDTTSYKRAVQRKDAEEMTAWDKHVLSAKEKYKTCEKFTFKCQNSECNSNIVIDEPLRKNEFGATIFALDKCVNTDCPVKPLHYLPYIQNQLTISMRTCIQKFYEGWLICEDPACPNRTRILPLKFLHNYPVCNLCEKGSLYREYTQKELYMQLCFFQQIFDIRKISLRISEDTLNAYGKLREMVERTLNQSNYSVINLTKLFQKVTTRPVKKEPLVKTEPGIKMEQLSFTISKTKVI